MSSQLGLGLFSLLLPPWGKRPSVLGRERHETRTSDQSEEEAWLILEMSCVAEISNLLVCVLVAPEPQFSGDFLVLACS